MPHIRFQVPFCAGKARPRFSRKGRVYDGALNRARERDIAVAFGQACLERLGEVPEPFEGDVYVAITAHKQLPASRPRRVGSEPFAIKPDADNIAKLVLDALNGIAWRDDAQVTHLSVSKSDRMRDVGDYTSVSLIWGGELE